MKRLFGLFFATSLLLAISACHSSDNGVLAPNVVGLTIAAATAKLQVYGLSLGTQTKESSATVALGYIISQSPSPGTDVDHGSSVNVVVSSGAAMAPAGMAQPSLSGSTTDGLAPAALPHRNEDAAPVVHTLTGSFGIAAAPDGSFYGVSAHGGANQDQGAFFRITPGSAQATLYSFGARRGDAIAPNAALIQGADGNFYGTSAAGGTYNEGTIFKITPAGGETVLFSFTSGAGNDPANPSGGLIQGADGNFYGTTRAGGANGTGAVFKLTPAGALSVLYSFGPGRTSDGSDSVNEIAR
jgi:uncharacterized repeat protein (TIGR03803 family)